MHSDNPAASLEPAEWIMRVLAYLIDGIVWVVGAFVLLLGIVLGADLPVLFVVALIGVAMLVWVAMMYKNGQSVGKRMLRLQVVNVESGVPLNWAENLIVREIVIKHVVLGIAAAVTFGIAELLNYLWPLWDARRQALHDKMLSTLVVKV